MIKTEKILENAEKSPKTLNFPEKSPKNHKNVSARFARRLGGYPSREARGYFPKKISQPPWFCLNPLG